MVGGVGGSVGGSGGGVPMCIAECGERLPPSSSSVSIPESLPSELDGDIIAVSVHNTSCSFTSVILDKWPLPRDTMTVCFNITSSTVFDVTLTCNVDRVPHMTGSLLSRHGISKSHHSLV